MKTDCGIYNGTEREEEVEGERTKRGDRRGAHGRELIHTFVCVSVHLNLSVKGTGREH